MMGARPFTPTREDPRQLDARTVGAAAESSLDRIVGRIEAALTGNLAHTLIVGPRGGGKTHMLAVAQQRSPVLRDGGRAVAVVVPEDAHGIVTYAELLALIARSLDLEIVSGRDDIGGLEAVIEQGLDGRMLVLVVENLDRLFGKLGRPGQHDLRSWVEASRRVLVLASAPTLFDDVQRRDDPWFRSFVIESLDELSAEEGGRLLALLRADDRDLNEFLVSPQGLARVQALHALTGGSPRLWTIFADVVTIELLDDLVPAVERLLEELVTYYQQRLWDLGPNEERVIMALATGAVSQTATELAAGLGLDQRTVGTTMGRLAESGWVRGRKVPGTDQRTTWYELREPLLRHYVQYRTERRSELTLVVQMLRHWFGLRGLEVNLTSVAPGTVTERYILTALGQDGPPSYGDGFLFDEEVDRLLLQARRWIADVDAPDGFVEAGLLIEGAWAKAGWGEARPLPAPLETIIAELRVPPPDGDQDAAILMVLDDLAALTTGRLAVVLEWVAATVYERFRFDDTALVRLRALSERLGGGDDPVALAVDQDIAHRTLLTDSGAAIDLVEDVVRRRIAAQGPVHPDTVSARELLAFAHRKAGQGQVARRLHAEIARDCAAHLGPRHPAARQSRLHAAWEGVLCGDVIEGLATALSTFEEIAPEPVFDDLVLDMAGELLGLCLAVLLRAEGTISVPDELRRGLAGTLLDAVAGDPAAMAQVPAGLRSIVEDARDRSHRAAPVVTPGPPPG